MVASDAASAAGNGAEASGSRIEAEAEIERYADQGGVCAFRPAGRAGEDPY